MKKLLTISLILIFGLTAFAQNSNVIVVANETPPSQDYNLFYVGAEAGVSSINNLSIDEGRSISPLTGFEISPVLGFRPFTNTNIAFELNVMIDSLEYISYDSGIQATDVIFYTRAITPQFLAVYTFGGGNVRPFAGLGMGANFNALAIEAKETASDGTLETVINNYDVSTSFSMVVKSGVKISIPDSNFDVYALCRYNVNMPNEIKFDNSTIKSTMNASNLAAAIGVTYNF
jgi:hypothetical protein